MNLNNIVNSDFYSAQTDEQERNDDEEAEHFRILSGTEEDYWSDEECDDENGSDDVVNTLLLITQKTTDKNRGQSVSDEIKVEEAQTSDAQSEVHVLDCEDKTASSAVDSHCGATADDKNEKISQVSANEQVQKDVMSAPKIFETGAEKESGEQEAVDSSDLSWLEPEIRMMANKRYPIEHCVLIMRSLYQGTKVDHAILKKYAQTIYDERQSLKTHSDVELAQYCLSVLKKQIVFLKSGEWMVWNNGVWDQTGKDSQPLENKVLDVLMSAPEHIEDQKQSLALTKRVQNSLTVNKVITSMKRLTSAVDSSKFDSNPDLFNCRNGVLNLSTFEFRQALPSDFLSLQANVEYQPDARCPRFEQFLREILNHDEELYLIVQALMGYNLRGGENVERLFFVFTGLGRNGKSTLVRVLMMLLGKYATAIALKSLLQGQQGGPRDDLMSLAQRRLLSISEFENPAQMSVGFIKSLVGRDTIKARHLYSTQSVDLVLSGVPIATTNNFPTVPGTAGVAFFDRLRLIPFNKRFNADEVNVNLLEEFKEEQSGILNLALEGLRRYREDRTVLTSETNLMLEAKEGCQIQQNPLHVFLKKYYIPTTLKEGKLSTKEIINDYEMWAADKHGIAKSVTSHQLKAEMEIMGIDRNETDPRGYCCRRVTD